jgi:hypothetical protein
MLLSTLAVAPNAQQELKGYWSRAAQVESYPSVTL